MISKLLIGIVGIGFSMVLSGCTGITRGTPIANTSIQANLNSGDYQVLGKTTGTSTKTSILFGLISVVDSDKTSILGIKLFEDQYAYADNSTIKIFGITFPSPVSTSDRAYYKALAAAPDADLIVPKSYVKTVKSFPILWSQEEVVYQGKALKLKDRN